MSIETPREFPAGWDVDKVIPGELYVPDDLSDEEIPPGLVVPYEPRLPVLSKTGSATMVAAAATGRACGLTARWFWTGLRATSFLGWRYVRAHDLQEVIGGMQRKGDWNKVDEVRKRRWKFLGWAAGVTAGLNLAGWWALVQFGGMTALDWSWKIPPALTAAIAAAAVTLYGRYRVNSPGIAPQQVMADQDNPEGEEPYPLAWVTSGGQAADCLGRALFAEGADYRDVKTLARHDWGWELEVILKGATPGKVQAAADQLESHLGLPDGGFMIEPDARDKSRIVVRLVQANPFADMPRPALHAPRSLSVHDVIAMGRAMDGSPFELTLDGFCALVIGAMGAGKTLGALRTLAEALTACVDAVCYDLDPIKGGLAEFGDLMAKRGRTPEECEEILEEVLGYVGARGHLLPTLDMGDRWHATEDHPNLYVFIDEFIQLSPKGKELAIKILRTGRQYGIYLIMAGQEATADALGDAIAMIVAFRILMACRFEDVRIAFGPGAGAQGWRPDRMKPAVGPIANDAGQAMIMGGLFNRAIRYQFNAYTRDQITTAVRQRIAAGVNRMDADTLLKAGAKLSSATHRVSLVDRVEAFAEQTGKEDARTIANLLSLYETKQAAWLPTALIVETGIAADGSELQAVLDSLVDNAVSRRDYDGDRRVRGWDRSVVEQAASALIAPS
jgi:S-DNA-T family DNA segregation ATPase FtsK/SpoIIIE